jgi:hypothetical protein
MGDTGLYSNLVPYGQVPASGTTASGLDAGTLLQIRNSVWDSVLPDGRLKTLLMSAVSIADMIGLWKELLFGRKYSQGEYEVAAQLLTKLQCKGVIEHYDIPDDLVPYAKRIMTMLFGVKIMNSVDLGRLYLGADAYYNNNPNRLDQPRSAVNRAVMLAQTFYNPYNDNCVDIRIFDQYPLVAPIPDMTQDNEDNSRGKYYTGPGFGNQQIVNGMLAAGSTSGLTSNIDTDTATGGVAATGSFFDKIMSFVKTDPLRAAAVGAALWFAWNEIETND